MRFDLQNEEEVMAAYDEITHRGQGRQTGGPTSWG